MQLRSALRNEPTSLAPLGTEVAGDLFDYSKRLHDIFSSPASRQRSSVTKNLSVEISPERQLPAASMDLKQATALYGMYLSFADRDRLFGELDFLLDPDGWELDDALPGRSSYLNFLKWSVETRNTEWTSLSLDGDGHIVVVFQRAKNQFTAAFLTDGKVHWTSRVATEDGLDVAAGVSPLKSFAQISNGLLGRI
jgi:hypothetical protein